MAPIILAQHESQTPEMKLQSSDQISLKEASSLYDGKTTLYSSSLNDLMKRRQTFRGIQSALSLELDTGRRDKAVSFVSSVDSTTDYGYGDYGYGDATPEPPQKRRRFERRNSKTPAMLMAMSAALVSLDFLDEDGSDDEELAAPKGASDDRWDTGLEIAEELVKHLQCRRRISRAA